ncbi:MAG: ribonuclease PH [Bacteriovoracaceae bacterium]
MESIQRSTPRQIVITPNINPYADGSVIVEFGKTKVHVTVMLENSVPPFLKGKNQGWLTAEYSMLPGSSQTRIKRDKTGPSGRSQEIQRLIGRSLRAITDLSLLGENTVNIDCDVLVADGGTRTASITGAYVALRIAVEKMLKSGKIKSNPLKDSVAAISIGISKEGKIIADLNYEEDSSCETDMNIVMTGKGKFVEVQGTAEGEAFSEEELSGLIKCSKLAMKEVINAQNSALKSIGIV